MEEKNLKGLFERRPGELEGAHRNRSQAYLPKIHLVPPTGNMERPVIFQDGDFRLLYNWYPFKGESGNNIIYEARSDDLLNWENIGVLFKGDTHFEYQGLFLGSAFLEDNGGYVSYSGRRIKEEEEYYYPLLARIGQSVEKSYLPILEDFDYREVKNACVFSIDGGYGMILAGEKDGRACLSYFKGEGLEKFSPIKEIDMPIEAKSYRDPSLISLDGYEVLAFTAEGMEDEGGEEKTYSLYALGSFDFDSGDFIIRTIDKFDYGFDFSSAYLFKDIGNRPLMLGIMGKEKVPYEEKEEGYSGIMSLPRELEIDGLKLIQKPIMEINSLKERRLNSLLIKKDLVDDRFSFTSNRASYMVEIKVPARDELEELSLYLFEDRRKNQYFKVSWNYREKSLVLDRSKTDDRYFLRGDSVIKMPYEGDLLDLTLIFDETSLEIFSPERVMTSRIFSSSEERGFSLEIKGRVKGIEIEAWSLKEIEKGGLVL